MGMKISTEEFIFNQKKNLIDSRELLLRELAITLMSLDSSLRALTRLMIEMNEREKHERKQISEDYF